MSISYEERIKNRDLNDFFVDVDDVVDGTNSNLDPAGSSDVEDLGDFDIGKHLFEDYDE